MPRYPVYFFLEDISYTVKNKIKLRKWLYHTINSEGKRLAELNFIFCSDDYLLSINQQYLKHDTYTDIITFDNSENSHDIAGDIFISIDRVKENALELKVEFSDELDRVIIHGVLHLLGFTDKSASQSRVMREKEDAYLSLRA